MESKYIPSEDALKFIAFLRASGNETHMSPEVHYRIADGFFSKKKEDRKLLIECTRGLGKSTLTEYAVIYAAAMGEWPGFGPVPFIVFLGASQEGNVKQFFKNVANKIERSSMISSVLTVKRQTDTELELVNADGFETVITGRGMSTNFRGLRSKQGYRPTMVIADDILSNEVATSETIRNTIDTNWYNSVLPALDPTKHKIIYIGTPINEQDLLHQLGNSGAYRVEKYPLCSKFPCKEEEYDSVWPDRFTYEYTRDMFKQYESAGKSQGFYQEYLLEVTDLSTLLVDENDIKWFDATEVVKNRSRYNCYISTDFATSTKKSADYSTIGVWAINNNGDWMLVDGQCKRQSMQENMDDLFKYVRRWKPLSVGIESSGQQGGFISILEDMMLRQNTWFTIAKKPGSKDPGIRPTKDKVHRFVTGVQPMFKQGKVWLPKPELLKNTNVGLYELVEELTNELSKFTLAGGVKSLKHDDACFSGDTEVVMADGTAKQIKDVRSGDEVRVFADSLTSLTENAIMTSKNAEVWEYTFSDGSKLKMTENHPVLTSNGWKDAGELTPADKIKKVNKWSAQKKQSGMMGIDGQELTMGTTNAVGESKEKKPGYIGTYTRSTTDQLKKVWIYTTSMRTKKTTAKKTWKNLQDQNTQSCTDSKGTWLNRKSTWTEYVNWYPTSGIEAMKAESTSASEERTSTLLRKIKRESVLGAVRQLCHTSKQRMCTVIENVNSSIYKKINNIKNVLAKYAVKNSHGIEKRLRAQLNVDGSMKEAKGRTTHTFASSAEGSSRTTTRAMGSTATLNVEWQLGELNWSPETVKSVEKSFSQKVKEIDSVVKSVEEVTLISKRKLGEMPVYNLKVAKYHNYLVGNGIVVHNCDLLNQLSEMEVIAPSDESLALEEEHAWVGDDGDIWWKPEDSGDDYGGSTVF